MEIHGLTLKGVREMLSDNHLFMNNLLSLNRINRLILTGLKRQVIHSKQNSRKKESTDIGTEERKNIQAARLGIEPRPLALRTSALTIELSLRPDISVFFLSACMLEMA